MANINTTNNKKNAVEICKELGAGGVVIEYIFIDGQKVGILGSVSDKDRQKAIDAIQTALDASDGDIYEMMQKLSTVATIAENNIEPDEMIEVCDTELIISYDARAAYTTDGEEIANCDDLPKMPYEAVKAVLIARAEVALQ
jgi:hypothetical protein